MYKPKLRFDISYFFRVLVIMNGLIEDDLILLLRERRKKQGLDGVGCKAIYGEHTSL
jgi:hypothetical protein